LEDEDDTTYGLTEYQRDKAQQSDSDDDEPGSSDTLACQILAQNHRLDIARHRAPAKQNVDRRVLLVDVSFHDLETYAPTWTGPREKTQEERYSEAAARQLRSISQPYNPGPYARPYDKPDAPVDRSGFVFPPQQYHRWGDPDRP
jgi:hypothetical protein